MDHVNGGRERMGQDRLCNSSTRLRMSGVSDLTVAKQCMQMLSVLDRRVKAHGMESSPRTARSISRTRNGANWQG